MNKERNSNYELLRIISIIFIIAYHYGRHGVYDLSSEHISFKKEFINFLSIGGQFGVSIFIIITGYFLVKKEFTFKRLFKIWIDCYYYSILGVIATILLYSSITKYELIKSIFPMIYERYWFVTSYILIILLSPYLNIFIKKSTKGQLQGIIFLIILIWGVLRTLFIAEINYSNIIWFCLLYLVGAYIRIYQEDFKKSYKHYFILSIIYYFIIFLLIYLLDLIKELYNIVTDYNSFLVKITSFPLFLSSVYLFLSATKYKNIYSKIINKFSCRVFSIYLIHDNDLVRNYLWRHILKTPNFQNSNIMYLHFLFSIIIIIIVSLIIDYISSKLLLNKLHKKSLAFCDILDKKIQKYV
ncbi:acyltransferase family protein [Gemelliphila palaticanis]|uniref:Acyltransferase family protein n=1 Tax=Gemelliphila palaticanis TaxID=81950 RepID=A0ABX2SZN8_9BACL|nr:acyltransferase family protein [Gemella palaticanis]MBF0715627.1 acyltransferase family protein [Gemella palaticanis]NYS47557.1 acyltransferase family protein [Gemella palaticanis]